MALDFLTIQPMSAECERLFSAAGQMMTPQRTALDAVILSICQCLRSWSRAGLIDDLDPLLKPGVYEDEQLRKVLALGDGAQVNEAATAWLSKSEDDIDERDLENCDEETLQQIFDLDEDENGNRGLGHEGDAGLSVSVSDL